MTDNGHPSEPHAPDRSERRQRGAFVVMGLLGASYAAPFGSTLQIALRSTAVVVGVLGAFRFLFGLPPSTSRTWVLRVFTVWVAVMAIPVAQLLH